MTTDDRGRPRILVAGIGNIFLGDDGFGVYVAQRLGERQFPPCVRVVDFGIRGLDLAYALMDGYDVSILIDAAPRGGQPGTIYTIEPEVENREPVDVQIETHGMNPAKVLELVKAMGGSCGRVLVVGCEPSVQEDPWEVSLSPAVQAAVDEAVNVVESLVMNLVNGSAAAH